MVVGPWRRKLAGEELVRGRRKIKPHKKTGGQTQTWDRQMQLA